MGKIRIERNFGATPNKLLNDPRISLKAKGLYGYIQSKPEDWDFSVSGIAAQTLDKRDSVASGIKELEDYGWLAREQTRNDGSFAGYIYILRADNGLAVDGLSVNGKTATSKQDISKQEKDITDSKEIGEIIKAMEAIDIKNKLNYSRKVQRDACTFLIKNYGFEKTLEMISAVQAVKNKIPYMPSITTPVELRDKWIKVVDAVERVKLTTQQKREVL